MPQHRTSLAHGERPQPSGDHRIEKGCSFLIRNYMERAEGRNLPYIFNICSASTLDADNLGEVEEKTLLDIKSGPRLQHNAGMSSPRGPLEGARRSSESEDSSTSESYSCTTTMDQNCSPYRTGPEDEVSTSEPPHLCLTLWKDIVARHLHPYTAAQHSRKKSNLFTRSSKPSIVASLQQEDCAVHVAGPLLPTAKTGWRCFTYQEIAAATGYFSSDNLVGKGGYSKVYKGSLPDGQLIAVKQLTKGDSEEQRERDFLTELGILGHISHPNTTALLGFCIEYGQYLIFHYLPHGSLSDLLHGPKAQLFNWHLRFKVAVGVARGLHYLHEKCQRRIIHRDIKASNILLGTEFEPQISDFGLAKWLPRQWTHHTVSPIEGTFGYLAPEYVMHGIVDEKTDVFAFGVLLLELISGQRPVETQDELTKSVKPILEDGYFQDLADKRIRASCTPEIHRLALTAALCVRQSGIARPSMAQVLQLLTDQRHDPEMLRMGLS